MTILYDSYSVSPATAAVALAIDPQTLAEPPAAVATMIARLHAAEDDADERREHSRRQVIATVIVLPLDKCGQPSDPPFKAYTRDLTTHSIALLHTRSLPHPHALLRIAIPGRPPRWLQIEVLRCRASGAFYDIAAIFRGEIPTDSATAAGRKSDGRD
ncbi:MAG: hypothetical protein K1X71_04990 [Pirellulales bacterium]|nr:hypothetical protein [Pirellulales bacterium]